MIVDNRDTSEKLNNGKRQRLAAMWVGGGVLLLVVLFLMIGSNNSPPRLPNSEMPAATQVPPQTQPQQ